MIRTTLGSTLRHLLRSPAPRLRPIYRLVGLLSAVGLPLLAGLTRWPVFLAAWREVAASPEFVVPALAALGCYFVTASFAYHYGSLALPSLVVPTAWGLLLVVAWAYAPQGEAAWTHVPQAVGMLTFCAGGANYAQLSATSSPSSTAGRLLLAGGMTLAGMLLSAWPLFPLMPLLALALYVDAAGIAAGITVPEMFHNLLPVLWGLGAWGLGVVLFMVLF